jgi:hypothetical protein
MHQALSVLPSAVVPPTSPRASSSRHSSPLASLFASVKQGIASLLDKAGGDRAHSSRAAAVEAAAQRAQADLQFIAEWNRQASSAKPAVGAAFSSSPAEQGAGEVGGVPVVGTFRLGANKFLGMSDEQWAAVGLGRNAGKPR